jgi:hypothetical protein
MMNDGVGVGFGAATPRGVSKGVLCQESHPIACSFWGVLTQTGGYLFFSREGDGPGQVAKRQTSALGGGDAGQGQKT